MAIPQELIDAITDEFPLRLDSISDLPDPETKSRGVNRNHERRVHGPSYGYGTRS
jgi:hypothetical protein